MYLMICTRPDIVNAVGAAAWHNSNPEPEHWVAAKRILRYLKGTVGFGLKFGGPDATVELKGFADAYWAGDTIERKSTSRFVVVCRGINQLGSSALNS